ncbi:RNA polymerase sigma factor [Actinoplanes sp. NPDC000266]
MTTDLRARIRAGDREAFGELFDQFARAVYNHGYRLTADWALAVPDHAGTADSRIDDARLLAAAMTALAALPRADREVFTLCVWEGLDYASTAAALGIPVGTVRSRLSRAREKLRRELPGGATDNSDHLTTTRNPEGHR